MRKLLTGLLLAIVLAGCTKTVVVQQPPSVSPECREWNIQWSALQDILASVNDPGDRARLVNSFYSQHPRPVGCEELPR